MYTSRPLNQESTTTSSMAMAAVLLGMPRPGARITATEIPLGHEHAKIP